MQQPQTFAMIGHETVLQYLEQTLKNGKIVQSVLFIGPNHIGKKKLIQWLIAHEMCNQQDSPCGVCQACKTVLSIETTAHPDIAYVTPIKNRISIDAIRKLRSRLQSSPLSSKHIWGVIPDAHLLTDEAANALLKVLEEPKQNARFILSSSHPDQILATIRSRCAIIRCQLVPTDTIYNTLVDVGVAREKALTTARLSQGRPGIAINFLKNKTFQQSYLAISRQFLSLFPALSPSSILNFLDEYEDTEPELLKEAITTTLRDCLMASENQERELSTLHTKESIESIANTTKPAYWAERLSKIQTLENDLRSPSKTKTTFERFLLNL